MRKYLLLAIFLVAIQAISFASNLKHERHRDSYDSNSEGNKKHGKGKKGHVDN
jgi:hypothetical protein